MENLTTHQHEGCKYGYSAPQKSTTLSCLPGKLQLKLSVIRTDMWFSREKSTHVQFIPHYHIQTNCQKMRFSKNTNISFWCIKSLSSGNVKLFICSRKSHPHCWSYSGYYSRRDSYLFAR